MKQNQLKGKLLLSQANDQKPFDYEAEYARIDKELAKLDLEKLGLIKKTETKEKVQEPEEFL